MVTEKGANYRHASCRRGSVAANVRPLIQPADGGSFFVTRATYPISDDRTKSRSWRALSRDPSFFGHAVGAVIAPRTLAPFLRILVITPFDGVCGDPKTEGHIVVSIRRCIFDQHELFQEIETNDPAVDLEVAAVNAGRNDRKIDYELGLAAVGFSACVDVAAPRLIASAARVAFFMAWFPEISISDL